MLVYEEFLLVQELLADLEDLQDLRQAKADEKDEPSVCLEEVKTMLNLS
ncbi:MAG: prevent-host-death family protein [Leptolyngbya sp. ERB_1_1]